MRAAWVVCAAFALAGCLPEDTRPPPGEVTVTVSSSSLTLSGIPNDETADGFQITLERFLVNVGEAALGNGTDSCNQYSNPSYTRAFDFTKVTSPAELGIAYATGRCSFGFALHTPNDNTLAGSGVAPADLDFMRTRGDDYDSTNAGMSVFVEGEAVRGDQVLHFAWPFRKRVGYDDCSAPDGTSGLELTTGAKTSVNVELHAEALFQGDPNDALHFEPFADADVNGDGEISFTELWGVPAFTSDGLYVSPIDPASGTRTHPCYTRDGEPIPLLTLGDYAYCELLPNIARFEGSGHCTTVSGRQPSAD